MKPLRTKVSHSPLKESLGVISGILQEQWVENLRSVFHRAYQRGDLQDLADAVGKSAEELENPDLAFEAVKSAIESGSGASRADVAAWLQIPIGKHSLRASPEDLTRTLARINPGKPGFTESKRLSEGGGAGIRVSVNLRRGSVESIDLDGYMEGIHNVTPRIADITCFVDDQEVEAWIVSADSHVMFPGYVRPESILGQPVELPAELEVNGEEVTGVVGLTFTEFGDDLYQRLFRSHGDMDEDEFYMLKQEYSA